MQELNFKGKFPQPLSYIGMRFIIITLIIISQLVTFVMCYEILFNPETDHTHVVENVRRISTISTSLVCVTTFAIINRKKNNPIRSLIFYAVLSILFFFAEIFLFTAVAEFIGEALTAELVGTEIASYVTPLLIYFVFANMGNLNIFIDLFFCLILFLAIVNTPKAIKKMASGKKKNILLGLYRSLAILPIAYVIVSIILKKYGDGNIFVTALLATNKIPSYAFFILVCVGYKIYIYVRKCEKPESFHLSLIMVAALVVVSLIEGLFYFIPGAGDFGLGKAYFIVLGIPFVLMYDYQTVTRHEWTIVFVFALQGGLYLFLFLGYVGLYIEVVNMIKDLIETIKEAVSDIEDTSNVSYGINYIINNLQLIT